MTGTLMTLILFAFMIVMILRVVKLYGRQKKNQKILDLLDLVHEPDQFFPAAEAYVTGQKAPEFKAKGYVMKLWGDTLYEKDDNFRKDLEALDLSVLIGDLSKKDSGYDLNEDSFFYLYMAIPNRLYYRKNTELLNLLEEKMETVSGQLSDTLLLAMHQAAMKLYENKDDCGKDFFRKVLDGDYGGYRYSRNMIGIYKNCITIMLAKIYQNEGNQEGFDSLVDDMKAFSEKRLGERWLEELDVKLPEEKSEKESEEKQSDEEAK